ncbi:MAG TPA: Hsp20/alpha crystallin family protein [Planctomycetota bacterium]|nr:Hsp20/alpha crystallin family protein [Planctomycetota bacterium]
MYSLFHQPARDFDWLREAMNNLFASASGTVHEFPALNVWANENGAIARAELPGIGPEALDISVLNDTLTLKGSRTGEELSQDDRWLRRERLHGEFSRSLRLPFRVNGDAVKADFKNGVLSVTLPRAESDKPRKITVKTV